MIDLDAIYKLNIIRPNSKAYLNYLYDYIISLFPTPDCFLEIGAFEASFSMRMRHSYPDSIIYAFEAGKTPIYYSGPYWDDKEIKVAIKAFLTGRWLVSGEKVALFQVAFQRKFGVKHAHMVNSGSSAILLMVAALFYTKHRTPQCL